VVDEVRCTTANSDDPAVLDRDVTTTPVAAQHARRLDPAVHIGLPDAVRQPLVDPDRPHPFTEAGNTEFNALIWMPPRGARAGDMVLIDSTHFTTLFGGTDSLRSLWRNLATMRK
jgi:hypothetical protein